VDLLLVIVISFIKIPPVIQEI